MSDTNIVVDNWIHLAHQLFSFDDNSTSIIDAFCDAWKGGPSSANGTVVPPPSSTAISDYVVTKTVGWTIIMILKTILFERKFDRWSGMYRVLNIGTTLVPFGMAAWTIYDTAMDRNEEESDDKTSSSSMTASMIVMNLLNFIVSTPVVRNWILTGLASVLLNCVLFGKIRSSKPFAKIAPIPGIIASLLSVACWITDETTVASLLLGTNNPKMLLVQARVLRWTANTISGWYCYAWIVKRIFRTKRFASFQCFLFVVAATTIITTSGMVL